MSEDVFSLYNELAVGVYACDERGRLTYYNSAAADIWGMEPQVNNSEWEEQWQTYDSLGHPFSMKCLPRAGDKKNVIAKQELTVRQPNGKVKKVLIFPSILSNEKLNLKGTLNILIDITDELNDDVKRTMLAALVESSDDAIISKTLDGMITSWNQGAEQLFGYTASEAIGQHISIIIPDDRLEEEKSIISKVSRGEKVDHYETVRRHKNGTLIPISLSISPIRNSLGQVIGASKVGRDISKQKLAEERLQNYTAHLEAEVAQRTHSLQESMKSLERAKEEVTRALEKERELSQLKSRFVSMASHEFRTPLSAVQLSVSLIDKYTASLGNENVAKHVRKIKAAVSNLNGILNDFLSLEKLDSGKVEVSLTDTNVMALIEEVTEEMQPLTKTGQNITYQHHGEGVTAKLDRVLIRNCLVNLISNAIKYSGENTLVEINTVIDNRQCTITVKDNGIGIPEGDQKHLFEAFFRAHNTGTIPGTGLGLNIVVRYVTLMKGKIDFESQFGQGSRFTLIFPVD